MRKIPTLFQRNPENMKHVLLGKVTPGCEWVLAGEGTPTRKHDGTCCMFDGSQWWARREVKPGKRAPGRFQAVEVDDTTGKTVGWEPMSQGAFARWHAEAVANHAMDCGEGPRPGTYELIGPKINGNPEHAEEHRLIAHADVQTVRNEDPFRLMQYCAQEGWEGIVWHHPDGRMAKLKVRDFPKNG